METEDKTYVTLYLKQEANIEQIRKDVEILMRTDLNLSHKQDMLAQKMDAMRERLDEGVSKTAWKTHEDVQDIKTMITEINGHTALIDDRIKTNTSDLVRLKNWVYWIAGVGVCGGLVGVAISLVKNPPW